MRYSRDTGVLALPAVSNFATVRPVTDANDASPLEGVRVLGPVSAPMERKAGRYRAQLLFQSRDRSALHRMLAHLRSALEGTAEARRVRWSVDVDPIELF